jgi:Ca-activated chloride channel family protein
MRYLLSFCLLLFSVFLLSNRMVYRSVVKGTVQNQSGVLIAGAGVTEKSTGNTVITGKDGSFEISLKSVPATLVISAQNYAIQEVTTGATTQLRIVLKLKSVKFTPPRIVTDSEVRLEEVGVSKGVVQSTPRIITMNGATTKLVSRSSSIVAEYDTEDYDAISENGFHSVTNEPLSTFSIDVDAASYSNVRRYLTSGTMPPPGAVRVEEMINYFKYNYPQPEGDKPFSVTTELAVAPWNPKHQLVRIGMQGKNIPVESLPASNLVFLIDVSGSMMPENKLPLVRASLKLLVDQMREKDRVALVVYAGSAGLVLPSTAGSEKNKIKSAIDRLEAGGSTAGGAGIELAYKVAMENFMEQGNNRVILCTDGDFNVGESSDASLEELISEKRKSNIFLTVLGYGMGNYKDNKMQKLADKGNGNHAYIDGINEAKKVLVHEFGGTLFTIAKDVKLQVEFNPVHVQSYRLIGYENRMLNKEDFNDDKKDAGELGSGHNVTALYEIIPAGVKDDFTISVDPLKYQSVTKPVAPFTQEILTVKLRYKEPKGNLSKLIEQRLENRAAFIQEASQDLRFAASVAEFGMLLGNSAFKQGCTYEDALQLARRAKGDDKEGYRAEFIELIKLASSMNAQVRK